MTSELRVTTLSNATGDGPATLLKQSAAKSFVAYKSNTSTTIYNSQSLNISSLTDAATGWTYINFTNNHSSSTYATSDAAGDASLASAFATWMRYDEMTSSTHTCQTGNGSWQGGDTYYHSSQSFGDLA